MAFTAGAAISVYVFGQVERMKGPHTTFVILAWLAPVIALATAGVYLIGVKVWSCLPSGSASFIAGISIAVLFWLLAGVGNFMPEQIAIPLTWIACLGGSFAAPCVLRAIGFNPQHHNGLKSAERAP
ncbi:MAG TPA: hypothetical protein VD965_09240 [Burkholderiales bacterium]|nr:hypothetical protein [Burkholderiales bacterium]